MIKFYTKTGGISILSVLILGIIVILVLGYFHIGLKVVVENGDAQGKIHYHYLDLGKVGENLWNNYLKQPASRLWNEVFVNFFGKTTSRVFQ